MVPGDVNGRHALASLTLRAKQAGPTLGIVGARSREAGESVTTTSSFLRLQAAAQSTDTSGISVSPIQLAQRAIMLSPYEIDGWKTLAYVRACMRERSEEIN